MVTKCNYSATANSCTRLINTAHTKSSQFVFASRFPVTDPNNVLCLRPYRLENISQLTKQSQSYCYDRRSVGQSVLVSSPIWDLRQEVFFSVRQLRVCCCGGTFLTTERVCLLQCTIYLHFTCYYMNVYTTYTTPLCVQVLYRRLCPTLRRFRPWILVVILLHHWLNWVWVWVLCYDRRSAGQSVLK
jgi:hypothetical protein